MEKPVLEFIKRYASIVTVGERTYFHLPNWFRIDTNGKVEVYTFESLPEELKEAIKDLRAS